MFLLILILNRSYDQTHTATSYLNVYYSLEGIAEVLSTFATAVFSLLHDKYFEANEKISNIIDESTVLFYIVIDQLLPMMGCMNTFSFF